METALFVRDVLLVLLMFVVSLMITSIYKVVHKIKRMLEGMK